jgi:hypothetical protein
MYPTSEGVSDEFIVPLRRGRRKADRVVRRELFDLVSHRACDLL